MVETKDNEMLKMLELQAEQVQQKSVLTQIIKNQKIIIKKLEENNRQFISLKRKNKLKRIIYLCILIFIFSYYDVFQLVINFLNYYHYFSDLIDKIFSIIQNTDTIQSNLSQILQKQKQILNLTVQNTDKVDIPAETLTKKELNTSFFRIW